MSMEGGDAPRWGPQSDELFFTNPSRALLSAWPIKASMGKFETEEVRKLLDLPLLPAWSFYDIDSRAEIHMFRLCRPAVLAPDSPA